MLNYVKKKINVLLQLNYDLIGIEDRVDKPIKTNTRRYLHDPVTNLRLSSDSRKFVTGSR